MIDSPKHQKIRDIKRENWPEWVKDMRILKMMYKKIVNTSLSSNKYDVYI